MPFRGRIFSQYDGYRARLLLELRLRGSIGAILCKRQWWRKWRDAEIRRKWLREIADAVLAETLKFTGCQWTASDLSNAIVRTFADFPSDGSDDDKRQFLETKCATVNYNFIWNFHWQSDNIDFSDEPMEKFVEQNEAMESYSMLLWYWGLVRLNERLLTQPLEDWSAEGRYEHASEACVEYTHKFIDAVRRGELTKQSLKSWNPHADTREHIVEALWLHVDRVLKELEDVQTCVSNTLEKLIAEHNLDGAHEVKDFISPGPVEETWLTDTSIPVELKQKFAKEVAVLEDVPDADKDWHPGSDNQVLDLVHPSLYCCVFEKTKQASSTVDLDSNDSVVDRMHQVVFRADTLVENPFYRGTKYQWIPSDFRADADGRVKILSYINNLHPVKHSSMYDSIERIFEKFLPLFDNVLSCLASPSGPEPHLQPPQEYYDREVDEPPLRPAVPAELPLQPTITTPFTLKNTKFQVIVKIAEIILTPEKPSYPGGVWHVEGMDAEQIVATGIYYFGCENITESRLSFRVIVMEPPYEQHDAFGTAAQYGLINQERLAQSLGAVTAIEDRCVVFPNTLQHKVEPFELADSTKPGVRKILAFFLVDPTKTIPSTSAIPPQQAAWLKEMQEPALKRLRALPKEVVDGNLKTMLVEEMSLEEAKAHRDGLMNERREDNRIDDDELFFSLCEH